MSDDGVTAIVERTPDGEHFDWFVTYNGIDEFGFPYGFSESAPTCFDTPEEAEANCRENLPAVRARMQGRLAGDDKISAQIPIEGPGPKELPFPAETSPG